MSTQPDFTVKIEQTHECGQVHEQTLHLFADDLLSFITTHELTMPPFVPGEPFTIPDISRPLINLRGRYDRVTFTGIEMRDHKIVCVKCGADMLFGDPAKEQEPCS